MPNHNLVFFQSQIKWVTASRCCLTPKYKAIANTSLLWQIQCPTTKAMTIPTIVTSQNHNVSTTTTKPGQGECSTRAQTQHARFNNRNQKRQEIKALPHHKCFASLLCENARLFSVSLSLCHEKQTNSAPHTPQRVENHYQKRYLFAVPYPYLFPIICLIIIFPIIWHVFLIFIY